MRVSLEETMKTIFSSAGGLHFLLPVLAITSTYECYNGNAGAKLRFFVNLFTIYSQVC